MTEAEMIATMAELSRLPNPPRELPILRATLDGTIESFRLADRTAPLNLLPMVPALGATGPHLLLLDADDTHPEQWAAVPKLREWARQAIIITLSTAVAYDTAIEFTLAASRVVLIHTAPDLAGAWATAMLPIPSAIFKTEGAR